MKSVLQDLRFGLRTLQKSLGFALIAVLTLALGIGANSTIFSWVSSTLLNPIPGATRTSQLLSIEKGDADDFSYLDYRDLRDENQGFSGLAASKMIDLDLTGSGMPERIFGQLVSANFFDVLRVRPSLGRNFLPTEDQNPLGSPVAVISYRLWEARFAGDPSVVGKTLSLDLHPFTILGVANRVFQGSETGLQADVWIPLTMAPQLMTDPGRMQSRSDGWLELTGRLKPGETPERAQEDVAILMGRIVKQFPESHQGNNEVTILPLWRAPYGANSRLSILLPPLLAISAIVLLLACANVANLLLVRSIGRRRELAVRLSLGASRGRLVRQMLLESLLISLAGGGLAILITTWTAGTFANFIPPTDLPLALNMHVDRTVLLATLGVSILASAVFGILPAVRASHLSPAEVLKEDAGSVSGGMHKAHLSSGLVVAQISLSLFLLVCAGLFIRSVQNARQFDPGFQPDHVLLVSYDLFPAGYTREDGIAFDRNLEARLESLPGVESATLASWTPFAFWFDTTTINPEGYAPQPHESMDVLDVQIAPDYFRTMKIPLLAGREFTAQDGEKSQLVAIVNQSLAERYWPGEDALGKRIHAHGDWYTVVGVARDIHSNRRFDVGPAPVVYLPVFQDYSHHETIEARVAGEPLAFASEIEKAVHEQNADLPVYDVTTMASQVELGSIGYRVAGTFVGAFGLLAMVLAAVGIYGVIAYTTRQRTREIGVRLALGAQRGDIFQLVLSKGLRLTILGLAGGSAVSLALTRFLRSLIWGVTATDALTYACVAALLCAVGLAACYLPARRAMRVNPLEALRHE